MRTRLMAACIFLAVASGRALAQEDLAIYFEESRNTADLLTDQLKAELGKELNAGGPPWALIVCRDTAHAIAGNLSRMRGWRISRVSLKFRNPLLGMPDAWEQKVLMDFDRRAAKGEKPESMEYYEIVTEPAGRFYRYMKGIGVQPMCLSCHGSPQEIPAEVKAKLAEQYPLDRATGYRVGQVRGAVTIKRPLAR